MGSRAQIRRRLICLAFALAPSALWADCAPDRLDLRGDWGTARFTVEVADDPEERAQGLMFREEMARTAGMLFVYEAPVTATFWMKNTPLPLDLIFADKDGVVQRVHENAIPFDESTIFGGDDIQYVLEVNAGMADLLGITSGSEMRHPSIGGAWSCE